MADLQAENKEDNNNQNISQHSKKISISGLKDKTKNCGNLCMTSILSAKFLLVAGIAISSAFIIEGLLCFALCSVNVRSYILSLYYMVFGLLSIGAELKYKLIGTIALGGEWWSVLIAVFLMLLAVLNITAGCQKGSVRNNESENKNVERVRANSNSANSNSGDWINNDDVDVEIGPNDQNDEKHNDENQNENNGNDSGQKVNPFAEYDY